MSFSTDLLAGKSALVTGGGSGIGRALSLAFARHGADVAILGRREAPLAETTKEIEALGRRSLPISADVREPEAIAEALTRIGETFGRLDIVVNGAAGNFLSPAEKLSAKGFSSVVDIDLKGTFHVSRAAFPLLSASRGVILNISAMLHQPATPFTIHASAAKAGIDALTRGLALEWGPHGIRVVGLAPGPTEDTEGTRRLLIGSIREVVERRTPLGRLTRFPDLENAALFLVSGLASFVNGVTLPVDGGLWLASSTLDPSKA